MSNNYLNLNDLSNLKDIYNNPDNFLNVIDGKYVCCDEALEALFSSSNIDFVEEIYKVKKFAYNNNFNPVGCCYGDYLSTYVLMQDNNKYYCQVFCVYNGSGADIALLLGNIQRANNKNTNNECIGYSGVMDIAEFAYALYKQDWIDEHTIKEERLDALKNYYEYQRECKEKGCVCDNYDTWLEYMGFGAGCYVCFAEFIDNEYLDEEYMNELLGNKELVDLYDIDIVARNA